MGAQTYEFGYQFGMKPGDAGYKGIKHYVFSRSMNFPSNAEVEFVKTDAVEYVRHLKKQPDKKLWLCGGGSFAGTMLDNGLIDELILKVNPSLLGDGVRLFGNSKRQVKLELLDLKRYTSGVFLSTYKIHY
jgi:dihydrofolate reductase